ncbi:MAG: tRNA (guanosine(46)-N7)-methyltransferase TrmB [Ilumatobacteraceae bacterium]
MSLPPSLVHPPQRSFKPRRRSLSPTRSLAYTQAMSSWGIAVTGAPLSFDAVFAGDTPNAVDDVVLDIGFGSGEALIEVAELRPRECVVGVDVHTPGIAAVLEAVQRRGLRNVRVVEGDVVDLLGRVPTRSLAGIRVFFPDPWPKRRQRGRRLIRREIVERLAPLLRVGGTLHLATDVDDYATQMLAVCDAVPELIGGTVERPLWRPITRYEQRAIDEGRRPVDLLYTVT